jgi:hypothetical protein
MVKELLEAGWLAGGVPGGFGKVDGNVLDRVERRVRRSSSGGQATDE